MYVKAFLQIVCADIQYSVIVTEVQGARTWDSIYALHLIYGVKGEWSHREGK